MQKIKIDKKQSLKLYYYKLENISYFIYVHTKNKKEWSKIIIIIIINLQYTNIKNKLIIII